VTLILRSARLGDREVHVRIADGVIASIREAGDAAAGGRRNGGRGRTDFGTPGPGHGASVTRFIDAAGLHLFPSLRNGHTHAAMTLFRGWGDDLPLMTWLQERIWPAEGRMTEEDVYRGTRLALLEMIRSGTTYLNDMYWHAPAIARAVSEMGLRAHVGAAFVDLGQESVAARWRREVERWLEQRDEWGPRVRAAIAPHAPYTVSNENLRWLGDLAEEHDLLYHIHLSETLGEVERCVAAHGVPPARLLAELGLVTDRLVAAHGVHLSPEEFGLLGEAGASVVTNPAANLKLAVGGIFDYVAARAAGVRVVIGTDGVASNNNLDLLEEIKLAALLQKHRAGDPTVLPAPEALGLATSEPARLFGPGTGRVAVGEPADLILVDLSGPSTSPGHDAVSDLVYAANGSVVHTTICDGRVLMHDRRVEVVDEAEVIHEAREAASRVTAG
jgi:5-methylthioadenosine/S-adenosylhomocysteine deaminase